VQFTEQFRITREADDDWFDPILSLDTPLFIDPFLIYARERGVFVGSHAEIIQFFNAMFMMIAAANGDRNSLSYKKALADLQFPEVQDLCLGYTATGTRGSGSGKEIARDIAGALEEAIAAGLVRLSHFEEIGILREGIGPDRISDISAWLLRRRLMEYTLAVCDRHPSIPTQEVRVLRAYYNFDLGVWSAAEARLPINPHNAKPILLVPKAYVRELPTINTHGFWDYCKNFEAEALRNDFNRDVSKRVSKEDIIAVARSNPRLVERYVQTVEKQKPQPYDLDADAKGLVGWAKPTQEYCAVRPLVREVRDVSELVQFVGAAVDEFRNFVELHEGWRCLWRRDRTKKDERAAQMLLLGIVTHYCKARGIRVKPAQNVGRGAVQFTLGEIKAKILVEAKLARTRRFWNRVAAGIPTHEKAESCDGCFFVLVNFDEKDLLERSRICVELVGKLKPEYRIKLIQVDAGHDDSGVWKPEPAVHIGDSINVNGPVIASALGSEASLVAEKIEVDACPDPTTYDV
jgi:hypothetical protein